MNYQTKSSILLIVFNRPKIVLKTFYAIKKAKPKKIYIFADGPRKNNFSDQMNCNLVRKLFERNLKWKCQIIKKYSNTNLGCKKSYSSALKWFFKHEEQGIIFDDDCVADISFFKYCDELLKKYHNNNKILLISGNNYSKNRIKESYFFSKNPCFYGWATWRRCWKKFDPDIKHWPKLKEKNWINKIFTDFVSRFYWSEVFDDTYNGKKNTWDYQWWLLSMETNTLTIRPKKNLVKHIGSGKDSTHIKEIQFRDNFETKKIRFPLIHPVKITPLVSYDKFENIKIWKITKNTFFRLIVAKVFQRIKNLKKKLSNI